MIRGKNLKIAQNHVLKLKERKQQCFQLTIAA